MTMFSRLLCVLLGPSASAISAQLPGFDGSNTPTAPRRGRLVAGWVSVLIVVCGSLAFGAVPASAASSHVFSLAIGSSGSGAGQLSSPQDVAVDDLTGDIYVADAGNDRVDEFDSAGDFVAAWGDDVDGTTGGDVCTEASGDTCQAGSSSSSPGGFETPEFVAVDNSGGASEGDVYVGDQGDDLVTKFTTAGTVVSGWGDASSPADGQLNGSSASGGPFSSIAGITVDASGNLYVYDDNSDNWFEFAQDGTPDATVSVGRGTDETGIGVDSDGNLYKVVGDGNLEQYDSSGSDIGDVTDDQAGSEITGFAIDPTTDDIYADDGGGLIRHYDGSSLSGCVPASDCVAADTFGSSNLSGSAAGVAYSPASGNVYVADPGNDDVDEFAAATLADVSTGQASNITSSGATLNGTVNPDGTTITNCQFDYVSDGNYNASAPNPYSAGSTASCSPTPSGSNPVAVSTTLTGLTTGAYHFRIEATNSGGTSYGQDQTFDVPAAPSVDSEQTTSVGTDSATITGEINPNFGETTYQIQYGTNGSCASNPCTSYPATPASVGDGSTDVPISVNLTGLTPGASYAYRLVATNSIGTTYGPDQTFTTPTAPSAPTETCPNTQLRYGYSAYLPDCRAYEQVSPVDKDGVSIEGDYNWFAAGGSGDAALFPTVSALPGSAGAQDLGDLYVASRGASGWSQIGLFPPESYGNTADVVGWSGDLSEALIEAGDSANASASGVEEIGLYLINMASGAITTVVPPEPHTGSKYYFAGSSADGSLIYFEHVDGTTPIVQGATPDADNLYVYDRDTGQVSLAGALPAADGGGAPTGGSFAAGYGWFGGNTSVGGAENEQFTTDENAISADGDRAYFTSGDDAQIWLRENASSSDATTVAVSASQRSTPDPQGEQPAAFTFASADGSLAYFTSPSELTNDSDTGSADQGNDLYQFDATSGQLTDISLPNPGVTDSDADGAEVQGVLGTSQDGAYVYFAANGVLAKGASQGDCTGDGDGFSGGAGTCNLYVWHDGATPAITYITTLDLSPGQGADVSDSVNWAPEDGAPYSDRDGSNTARLSANGLTLLFSSQLNQTGYDSHGIRELYRYSAADGEINCVSCDPSGVAPTGPPSMYVDGALSPGAGAIEGMAAEPQDLDSSGDRVFFESPDALVPQDTNSVEDVYEWEADGTGSCTSDSANGGCLYLISSGRSPDPSYLLGASASGDDVFIITDQQLVGQDQDDIYDVYDARVDGGLASQNPTASNPCTASDCRPGAPAAPASPAAATVTFSGPGNELPQSTKSASARVKVTRKTISGSKFTLSVKVPAKGRLTIGGADVRKLSKSAAKAGTYKLVVRLTAKAKRRLKARRKLKAEIKVAYKPASGSPSTVTVSVELKA